jgi:hypothetical protein
VPKQILVDEFHLTVNAPRGLPNDEYVAMRRTLDRVAFRRRLGQAVRDVIRTYPSLDKARVTISR